MSPGNTESVTMNLPNLRLDGKYQALVKPNPEYTYTDDHYNDASKMLESITPKPDKYYVALTTFYNSKKNTLLSRLQQQNSFFTKYKDKIIEGATHYGEAMERERERKG